MFFLSSLVFQDNVREPDSVVWDTDGFNAVILRRVPDKPIIGPLLQMKKNNMYDREGHLMTMPC